MSKNSKLKVNYLSIFIEFLSVFIGVLLAFSVSEWQNDQEKNEKAQYAINSVYFEIKNNLAVIKSLHKNNLAFIETIDNPEQVSSVQTFIPGIQLLETSWQIAQSKELANHVDYEILSKLYEAYALLSVYKNSGDKLTASSLDIMSLATVMQKQVDTNEFKKNYADYFKMMTSIEKDLIEKFSYLELHLKN